MRIERRGRRGREELTDGCVDCFVIFRDFFLKKFCSISVTWMNWINFDCLKHLMIDRVIL